MNTILITGGTGFLGGSLVRRLAHGDNRLVLLVRNKNRLSGNSLEMLLAEEDGEAPPPGRIELVEGDITLPHLGMGSNDFSRLAAKVDMVFHCAALTDFSNRDALVRTNAAGTRQVLDFAIARKLKRYHHISSAYVVENGVSRKNSHGDSVSSANGFNNTYGKTKYAGELLVKKYTSLFQLPATIYRPSIIVGHSRSGYTKCFKGMYSFAKALYLVSKSSKYACNESFRIFGDKEAAINLVPIDYVADSIVAIAKDEKSTKKTFHIINPHPPTLYELNVKIAHALGMRTPYIVPFADRYTLSSLERFYLFYTRPYLPYVHNRFYFDSSNTQDVLGKAGITCPRISQRLVSILMDFAIRNNWGDAAGKRESVLAGVN